MYCKHCGKRIDDTANSCPYCGVSTENLPYMPIRNVTNTIAIVGFILSFFIGVAGLVCSIIGYIKANREGLDHEGLALAGIFIGIVVSIIEFILIFA